jgi:hypothetical protein
LVERRDGGWRITDAGRSALDVMERKPTAPEPSQARVAEPEPSPAINEGDHNGHFRVSRRDHRNLRLVVMAALTASPVQNLT